MAASRFIDQARFSEPRRAVGAAPLRSLVPWYVGQSRVAASEVDADGDAAADDGGPLLAGGCVVEVDDPLQPATSIRLTVRPAAIGRMSAVFPPGKANWVTMGT